MKFIPIVLRSALILTLSSNIVSGSSSHEKPDFLEQTIEAIKDCMTSTLALWPDEWKKEYLETIRSAIELQIEASHYAERLEILRRGFELYWESFEKISERSFFELHCARIRWYTEHLMSTEFPSEEERQKLRDQYTNIWDFAAKSLIEQFPFLDPNVVQKAKAEELNECYRKIESPLMPVYLRPMSEDQVAQIKQRWDSLRYTRVNLLRKLVGDLTMPAEKSDVSSADAELDYELTKESLSQLLGLVWMVVPKRPDYYLNALENRNKALKEHIQTKRMAWNDQQRMEKERSRQLLQIEHISFMLAALLETVSYNDGSDSIRILEQNLLERQDNTVKGVGAYAIESYQTRK